MKQKKFPLFKQKKLQKQFLKNATKSLFKFYDQTPFESLDAVSFNNLPNLKYVVYPGSLEIFAGIKLINPDEKRMFGLKFKHLKQIFLVTNGQD